MKKLLLSIFAIFVSSCASAGKHESLKISGNTITLNQIECKIESETSQIVLGMSGDCYFVRHSASGLIDTKYYKDINAHVALVIGDQLARDPDYPVTMNRSDCGSTIKAIIINHNKIYLSDKSFSDTVTCAGVGADEKEYYMLSH